MNKAETYDSIDIMGLLKNISPEEYERTEKRMLLAARIDDEIKNKGWKKKDFAAALVKTPSEITKWLSGTHNFTSDTLFDIERVLNIKLINYQPDAEEIFKSSMHKVKSYIEQNQRMNQVLSEIYEVYNEIQQTIPAKKNKSGFETQK
jgi:transcriptional regulator with XRE-family HTH domain